jgi:hypothetical protein
MLKLVSQKHENISKISGFSNHKKYYLFEFHTRYYFEMGLVDWCGRTKKSEVFSESNEILTIEMSSSFKYEFRFQPNEI